MTSFDLIDKYIQKTATPEELLEIQRLLKEDPVFKKEFYFHLELKEAIRIEENQKLKKQLQQLETAKNSKKLYLNIYKIAAILIIGLGILWFFNASPNYDKIYAENFEPFPNIVAPTVRNHNHSENKITKAFSLYDNQNYTAAAIAFKELYDQDKVPYANFYYAMSLMGENQFKKAIESLENPDWEVSEQYEIYTYWYLGLAHLKLGDKDKAKDYLHKTIQANHPMAEQAQKILDKIK